MMADISKLVRSLDQSSIQKVMREISDRNDRILRQVTARSYTPPTIAFVQNNPFNRVVEEIQASAERSRRGISAMARTGELFNRLAAASRASSLGLGQISEMVQRHQSLTARTDLGLRLFKPTKSFEALTAHTLAISSGNLPAAMTKALAGSLTLATSQYLSGIPQINTLLLKEIVPSRTVEDVSLNLFECQQAELIQKPEMISDEDSSVLLDVPEATELEIRARRVFALLISINQTWSASHGGNLFDVTNITVQAASELPFLVSTDGATIGAVVDFLYMIFYEGSEKTNRLLVKNRGILTHHECTFVDIVSHFRNFFCDHDIENDPTHVQAKRQHILTHLKRWGVPRFPVDAHEYQIIHRQLLTEAEEFLELISAKIT